MFKHSHIIDCSNSFEKTTNRAVILYLGRFLIVIYSFIEVLMENINFKDLIAELLS